MKRLSLLMRKAPLLIVTVFLLAAVMLQPRLTTVADPRGSVFPTHAVTMEDTWRLEIANTDPLRELGLGDRDSLPIGSGMLFLFEVPRPYGFWMKGMRFSIDMVFLSRGKVVFIERGIQPGDPRIITPPESVDQVLELNAGEANKLSLGDRIWYWRSF